MNAQETDAALQPLRERIDALDKQLVELLNERAEVVVEVGKVKRGGEASPIYAPERERRVLEQVRQWNSGPLSNSCIEAIWRELMSGSFALERALRIGYLGPAGTFSHMAARRKFGASVDYDELGGISAVFEEVQRGHIDLGVVPIENSIEGGVGETLDSFLETQINVCAEILISIHHNLLSNSKIDQITKIYSHPQALGQCRGWLSGQLREADRVPVASTSLAVKMAAQEPGAAAIGSALAGEIYELHTLFANIEGNPNNTTRFFVIGNQSTPPTGEDKTAIMFTTAHESGALSDVLDVFKRHELNLTHIDKRPSKRVNWEYYFFVDFLGHVTEQRVNRALEDAKRHCLQLTVLGSFPKATDVL